MNPSVGAHAVRTGTTPGRRRSRIHVLPTGHEPGLALQPQLGNERRKPTREGLAQQPRTRHRELLHGQIERVQLPPRDAHLHDPVQRLSIRSPHRFQSHETPPRVSSKSHRQQSSSNAADRKNKYLDERRATRDPHPFRTPVGTPFGTPRIRPLFIGHAPPVDALARSFQATREEPSGQPPARHRYHRRVRRWPHPRHPQRRPEAHRRSALASQS